jgi:hypothetical protein
MGGRTGTLGHVSHAGPAAPCRDKPARSGELNPGGPEWALFQPTAEGLAAAVIDNP